MSCATMLHLTPPPATLALGLTAAASVLELDRIQSLHLLLQKLLSPVAGDNQH